jgi:hypothetical protein
VRDLARQRMLENLEALRLLVEGKYFRDAHEAVEERGWLSAHWLSTAPLDVVARSEILFDDLEQALARPVDPAYADSVLRRLECIWAELSD